MYLYKFIYFAIYLREWSFSISGTGAEDFREGSETLRLNIVLSFGWATRLPGKIFIGYKTTLCPVFKYCLFLFVKKKNNASKVFFCHLFTSTVVTFMVWSSLGTTVVCKNVCKDLDGVPKNFTERWWGMKTLEITFFLIMWNNLPSWYPWLKWPFP